MPDSEAVSFGEVYYEPSDLVGVYAGSDVVFTLPVLIRRSTNGSDGSGGYFVLTDGRYYPAETLSGFLRVEPRPKMRPRVSPPTLPTYEAEPRALRIENQNIYDRLAEAQKRWQAEKSAAKG